MNKKTFWKSLFGGLFCAPIVAKNLFLPSSDNLQMSGVASFPKINRKPISCVGVEYGSKSPYVYSWDYDESGRLIKKEIYGFYPQYDGKYGSEIEESLKNDPNSPYPPKS